jgi:hypothetical protein
MSIRHHWHLYSSGFSAVHTEYSTIISPDSAKTGAIRVFMKYKMNIHLHYVNISI